MIVMILCYCLKSVDQFFQFIQKLSDVVEDVAGLFGHSVPLPCLFPV